MCGLPDSLPVPTCPMHLQAYMWCAGPQVPTVLPSLLAKPWATVSAAVHMPPVLVYATYNLLNWRRLDETQPVELGNLAVQHVSRFYERWIVLTTHGACVMLRAL